MAIEENCIPFQLQPVSHQLISKILQHHKKHNNFSVIEASNMAHCRSVQFFFSFVCIHIKSLALGKMKRMNDICTHQVTYTNKRMHNSFGHTLYTYTLDAIGDEHVFNSQ